MSDCMSSSESLVLNSRETKISNRPDLGVQDFHQLDKTKVEQYRRVLVGGSFINGVEDEPITPNMVEEDGVPFARGSMTYVFGGTIKGQCFAFKRSWITIDDNLEAYNKEIKSLQTLRKSANWHVVQLVGHYIMPANEGRLVLSPLAECTLEAYISQNPTLGRKVIVTRWFGCLAGALKNIHDLNIKHKDIKTENILVHGENIIITDLGISNKFTERSTSLGDSPGSLMYMAPEVRSKGRRGRQQDIWSLTCCFIEMLSFIMDFTISDFRKWCTPTDWLFNFNNDYDRVIAWLHHLSAQTERETHLALIDLLVNGLKKEPKERPTANYLFDRLCGMGTFVGECCALPRARNVSESKHHSLSLSTDPQLLEFGSLGHFIVSAGLRITRQLDIPSIRMIMNELLEDIELNQVRSFRSAERKVIFYVAPRICGSAEEYLSFCNAFIEELANAVGSPSYLACLYDEQSGENERQYSTAYFAILVEEVLSRCRTNRWAKHEQ